jgi:hypothetical protein
MALNALTLISLGVVLFVLFSGQGRLRLKELSARRVDIAGPDGRPVLALAHRTAIPGPSINGKNYPPDVIESRPLLSGMIFFNDQGDEVGGLIYNGITRGSGYSAVGHLSFDQWRQNQVVAIQYNDNGRTRRAGLNVWDRPTDRTMDQQLDLLGRIRGAEGEERDSLMRVHSEAQVAGDYGVQRLFAGSRDETAQVELRDTAGRVRARLSVDAAGVARLEFLDESGRVVATYPGASAS